MPNISFEIGDLVKLISDRYGVSSSNPVWGEYREHVTGRVSRVRSQSISESSDNTNHFDITVDWSNGCSNDYHHTTLCFIPERGNTKKYKLIKDDAHIRLVDSSDVNFWFYSWRVRKNVSSIIHDFLKRTSIKIENPEDILWDREHND